MSEKLELYVYTTRSYMSKNYLKVGHCKRGRHMERINEQFGTASPEQPIVCWFEDLPEGKTDHHIHQQLIANAIFKVADSVGQEWFVATIDDVKRAFNAVCYGSSRIESYRPRQEQQSAVDKAVQWFKGDYPPPKCLKEPLTKIGSCSMLRCVLESASLVFTSPRR